MHPVAPNPKPPPSVQKFVALAAVQRRWSAKAAKTDLAATQLVKSYGNTAKLSRHIRNEYQAMYQNGLGIEGLKHLNDRFREEFVLDRPENQAGLRVETAHCCSQFQRTMLREVAKPDSTDMENYIAHDVVYNAADEFYQMIST
eukprot:g49571.t1